MKIPLSTRDALRTDYERISRDRNGLSPKTSLYAKLTEQMESIREKLKEYADPEEHEVMMRKRRAKSKRHAVLRKQALTTKV